jgi:hypothetical protein
LPNSGYGHRSGRELQVGAFAFYTWTALLFLPIA